VEVGRFAGPPVGAGPPVHQRKTQTPASVPGPGKWHRTDSESPCQSPGPMPDRIDHMLGMSVSITCGVLPLYGPDGIAKTMQPGSGSDIDCRCECIVNIQSFPELRREIMIESMPAAGL
jgi:hypothetical protein